MISRVFQKSGASGGATTSGGGSKKGRLSSAITLYPEPSSPSSVSLPPLLDFSPYAATAGSGTSVNLTDREGCSYDSPIAREHVSCFSTIAAAAASAAASSFNLAPPPQSHISAVDPYSRYPRNVGVSAFPSLRSLQENLQLPFFFSQAVPQPPALHAGGSADLGGCSSAGTWPMPEDPKVEGGGGGVRMGMAGPTELDCMWTF